MLQQTWEQTDLWKEILRRASGPPDPLPVRLTLLMREAEATLAHGETAPADFTLHDEGHGFRVAQRMSELIGIKRLREFSLTELALLLASAYLHDIGMTPKRGNVRRHRDYLLTGEPSLLQPQERDRLQAWLDDYGDETVPPLAKGTPDAATLARADELLTYYCRSRHNDWSEEWVREHVKGEDRELYPGFADDLVQLCRSHHEGYDQLIASRFDAKLVGPDIVHPRYLAALLRMADILEFDPERTPEIIFRHRDVAPSSTIYWHKDHEVAFRREDHYFIFYARPKDAATFQALRQMATEIDEELSVCARLEKEGRFQLAPLRSGNDPRYEWRFEPRLKRDLHPKDGTFEEFEGAFQPNPRRLLALLGGTQLYGTPLAAVRELLQNAFDAVREQIAYERLAEIERFGTADAEAIAARHFVTLELRQNGERWELVCTDSGIGMTREVLRRRFLTTGSGRGHRQLDLERRCQAHGFSVGRTGEFGIGALSYFILADRVHLVTHRSAEPGDFDGGWEFTVGGLNDFGELRRTKTTTNGTTVTLRLRPDAMKQGVETLTKELRRYLLDTVCRVPCRFVLKAENDATLINVRRGWLKTTRDIIRGALGTSDASSEGWLNHPFAHEDAVLQDVRWDVVDEPLPDGGGYFRIHFLWFDLNGARSRTWFHVVPGPAVRIGEECREPHSQAFVAWSGMRVENKHLIYPQYGVVVEVDIEKKAAGRIAVNRSSIEQSDAGSELFQYVSGRVAAMGIEWLSASIESPFCTVASRLMATAPDRASLSQWAFQTEDDTWEVRPIRFPAARNRVEFPFVIDELEAFPGTDTSFSADPGPYPNRLFIDSDDRLHFVFVWTDDRNRAPLIDLPESWTDVVMVEREGDYLFNRRNPLVGAAPDGWSGRFERPPMLTLLDPDDEIDPVSRLLLVLRTRTGEWWADLDPEERRLCWDSAMRLAGISASKLVVTEDVGDLIPEVTVYTRDGATVYESDELTPELLDDLFPLPPEEWLFDSE